MDGMDKRNSFLLTLATTFTVGWFGIVGVIYFEMIKPIETINEGALKFVYIVGVILTIVLGFLYTWVGHNVFGDE